ncbi:hypothetical protein JW906_06435 [bacterium]|nr:hypothetical protein [bacterium]
MVLDSAQKKLLDKILSSSEFENSKIYQTYLTYLVESTAAGRELKETTIAIEVFGKDARFNPAEDTTVRSHTYTLRKKLESYYFHEGVEDKFRLKIPRGHYSVKFEPAEEHRIRPKGLFRLGTRNDAFLIVAALLALVCFLGLYIHSQNRALKSYQTMDPADPVWREYLGSKLPILIVVGDHFFFDEKMEKYSGTVAVRHPGVNSMEDLRTLFPEKNGEPSSEPYFPYHSIWSLPPILSILYASHKPFILRKSSDISPQILDEYNIIFLGSIKTLYKLKHTLLKSHFQYEIMPHRVLYKPDGSDSTEVFITKLHSPGPNEDLVLALKLPGPNRNSIFIIASYHSLGAPTIANYMTSPDLRAGLEQKFMEKLGRTPRYFEILFRVTGIDKTPYSTEILVFDEIREAESL